MKKLLSTTLVLSLVLSLVACMQKPVESAPEEEELATQVEDVQTPEEPEPEQFEDDTLPNVGEDVINATATEGNVYDLTVGDTTYKELDFPDTWVLMQQTSTLLIFAATEYTEVTAMDSFTQLEFISEELDEVERIVSDTYKTEITRGNLETKNGTTWYITWQGIDTTYVNLFIPLKDNNVYLAERIVYRGGAVDFHQLVEKYLLDIG